MGNLKRINELAEKVRNNAATEDEMKEYDEIVEQLQNNEGVKELVKRIKQIFNGIIAMVKKAYSFIKELVLHSLSQEDSRTAKLFKIWKRTKKKRIRKKMVTQITRSSLKENR